MMKNQVKILDCTLRDGGYVNDWCFGDETSKKIVSVIDKSGCEYVEVGFLRNEKRQDGRMVFENMSEVDDLFPTTRAKQVVMVELGYDYPLDMLPNRSATNVAMIRVMIWKRMINEGLAYCRALKEKGYEVGVQATLTDEYTDAEFADFVKLYNEIHPTALYVVDSFGVMNKEQVLRYVKIADELLDEGVVIGYHAHNNLQQAYTNTVAFIEHEWKHSIMVDASVLGMGRGAGNLPLELVCKYLNDEGADYKMESIVNAADLLPWEDAPWGYSMPYMLSALYGRNPSFVNFYVKRGYNYAYIAKVFEDMRYKGIGIKFDAELGEKYITGSFKMQ